MRIIAALLFAGTTAAGAQTVVDESAKGLPALDVKKVLSLISDGLRDPVAVQVKDLRKVSAGYCGQMNAKNAYGAYTGFRPFFVDLKSGKAKYPDSENELLLRIRTLEIEMYDCK